MATKPDLGKLKPTEERAFMQRLSQQSAAWVAGMAIRKLRDRTDAPRNPDGSYDAAAVVKWSMTSCIDATELDDSYVERLLVIVDDIQPRGLVAAVETLRDVRLRFGAAGLARFTELVIEEWGRAVDTCPDSFRCRNPQEINEHLLRERERLESQAALESHKVAVVCDDCGRLRRGRRWVKTSPPAGYEISPGMCPECDDK